MYLDEIQQTLQTDFQAIHLEVINESFMHSVPKGSLTHIKVIIVSDSFVGENLLERHRAVYNSLTMYMQQGLHAVSVHAYTKAEWQTKQSEVPDSPVCRGGRKKEHG